MNDLYLNLGLIFNKNNGIIEVSQVINEFPQLKENLREKFGLTYNKRYNWHIGKFGHRLLSIKDLKVKSDYSQKVLADKLRNHIEEIEETKLKSSIIKLLKKFPYFIVAPGAKFHHHAYEFGLLEHTIQTIELSLAICNILKLKVNKDIIRGGSILHDFGKINCYRFNDGGIEVTDTILEQEHIINGIKLISQNIESEFLDDLLHIIASHHNLKEWGSPVSPISIEAWVIHFADNISGKVG